MVQRPVFRTGARNIAFSPPLATDSFGALVFGRRVPCPSGHSDSQIGAGTRHFVRISVVFPARVGYQPGMNGNPPVPPVPQPKKGIPVLGWVGIGCGTMLIIAIIVISLLVGWCKRAVGDISEFKNNPEKAAAEMMVRLNPELTKVSQDDVRGEMTVRTKDGQEMTMSYKDISEGKFTIKDARGDVAEFGGSDLTKVPAWVPRVPDIKTTSASIRNSGSGKLSGLYAVTSGESIDALDEFFKAEAAKLKFTESNHTTVNADGVESRTLNFEGNGRTLNIVITGKPGENARVNVGYEEEK